MREHKPKGVVHCFSGSAETAEQLLDMGLYIGFTGVLTFKNAKKAKRAFSVVPADRLLFETDCPYMAPVPHRGKRNESAFVAQVLTTLAAAYGVSEEEMARRTNENVARVFGI